jgi:hypothetical protein
MGGHEPWTEIDIAPFEPAVCSAEESGLFADAWIAYEQFVR